MTERDLQVLKFINTFGFCERSHLEKKFGLSSLQCRDLMRRLKKEDFLVEEQIFYQRPKAYYLTRKGASYTEFPPLRGLPIGFYHHDIGVIDVYLMLMQSYKNILWQSERFLRRAQRSNKDRKGHIPDGLLILEDGKQVAIEVELTLKDPCRLREIFKAYALSFEIEEVWYFCSELLLAPLQKAARDFPFIKLFNLTKSLERGGM